MNLWIFWWETVQLLRPAFSRQRTFLWFALVLAAFSVRSDLLGVTSFVRALCLREVFYERLLQFFHSKAVKIDRLAQIWFKLVIERFPIHLVNGRPVLILDGFKNPKEGKKMPAVKFLHQQSESNSKPQFVMGHSFQAFGILCRVGSHYFSVPACARIHEGVVRSNRDKRTLIDKANEMLSEICQDQQFVLLADAYYANGKVIRSLKANSCHLITRVRSAAIGYKPAPAPLKPKRGRPKKYGNPIKLQKLFGTADFDSLISPIHNEGNVTIRYTALDLLWRPAGEVVRFVLVDHPIRGRIILLSTDLDQEPREIILQYSLRFKIEVSFKQAVYSIGAFGYHFWMADMRPIKRGDGNQYLHRESDSYRRMILRKIHAYHVFVQVGMIAQGMLQYLAMKKDDLVWKHFGTWIRTIRPDVLPSEMIVSEALKNTLSEFLVRGRIAKEWRKFLLKKVDFKRPGSSRFAA